MGLGLMVINCAVEDVLPIDTVIITVDTVLFFF